MSEHRPEEKTPTRVQAFAAAVGPEVATAETALVPGQPGALSEQDRLRLHKPLSVEHVANFNKRYPGETTVFHTRVHVRQDVAGFTVRIAIPDNVAVVNYGAKQTSRLPDLETGRRLLADRSVPSASYSQYLVWRIDEAQPADTYHEFEIAVRVQPVLTDTVIMSRAWVLLGTANNAISVDSESVSVNVLAKGRYLDFLPALYEQDEFLGRFLMLFESFWAPISTQIDNVDTYFDPMLAPPHFLPWMASWINLTLNERWPEAKQRRLLAAAARLYRIRGTKIGLAEYLEIFTDHPVDIVEHRANNLRLGPEARLGMGVALGKENRPFTFTVYVHLPPIEPYDNAGRKLSKTDLERTEAGRRRSIEAIIDAEKPAHTSYTLVIRELEG